MTDTSESKLEKDITDSLDKDEHKVAKSVNINKFPTRKSLINSIASGYFYDDFAERFDFTVSYTSLAKNELNKNSIDDMVRYLDKLCLKPESDPHRLHLNRKRAVKVIKNIARTANSKDLREPQICHIIWAMCLCMHHFHNRLKSTKGLISYLRRRRFKKSTKVWKDLLAFIPNVYEDIMINCVFLFLREGKLWRLEYLSCEIVIPLIIKTNNFDEILRTFLYTCEVLSIEKSKNSSYCMAVICLVMDSIDFEDTSFEIISVILHMYRSSIEPLEYDEYNYATLKSGLLYCLLKLIPFVDLTTRIRAIELACEMLFANVSSNVVIEMSYMIEKVGLYGTIWNDFTSDPKVIAIQNTCFSHWYDKDINIIRFLTKVFINSADVLDNKKLFETPRLFLENEHYGLKVKKINISQKQYDDFLGKLREALMACLKNFNDSREVLERVYCIICIYCCQLPSGMTAASVCSLAMGIQNHALEDQENMSFEHQSYLHAMAISLLSLVCHIHKADHFYHYVNEIIYNRSSLAYHMLPPLKVACEYPRHLVLSNPSEFLLDKWEVRYGLWKTFRIKGKKYENEFAKFTFNSAG